MVRASRISHLAIVSVALLLFGCGSSESPFEQTAGSALGKSHCAGTPVASTKHKFESTGRTVVIDACPPGATGNLGLATRDAATGKAVDFEDLRGDDATIFHDVRGTIAGKMEAFMTSARVRSSTPMSGSASISVTPRRKRRS
ncbi:MAG: hypothetical protein HYZ29_24865 [Myxococcales bacterium]|nr:hypothetical protein [Myxococcales bacterium]